MRGRLCQFIVGGYVAVCLMATPAISQDATSDLAKKLSYPAASLISVPFQFNHNEGLAGGNGTQDFINVQPVIPVSISYDWNVISRTDIPFISPDGVPVGGGQTQGIGNVVQSFFFSPKEAKAGELVWGACRVFQLPTSSDDLLGPKQFGAGITAVNLIQKNGWTYEKLANHICSIDQEVKYGESSNTLLQPFVSYSAPRGTSVTLDTESTCNWVSKEWLVPVNLSVAKIVKLSVRPVQLAAGVRYWADGPTGGPDRWGTAMPQRATVYSQ